MEEIAAAAFYIEDVIAGRIGEFTIEEKGWGQGDGPRAYAEIKRLQSSLIQDGWSRSHKLEEKAPFTSKVEVAIYYKKFPSGKFRWCTITATMRFGICANIKATAKKPSF